ncbi:Fk506 Hypothetical protein protein [Nesidiocoris tenuis]|uniref:peptidylprolyl isomerase n=1 Tax=Nesidiocoris tenuis TaxID=355587 RepID=A0ABN7B1R6_9HEMI|nr:Fk506 Hypothetical protein protein [Nesidiocoris tenuis]
MEVLPGTNIREQPLDKDKYLANEEIRYLGNEKSEGSTTNDRDDDVEKASADEGTSEMNGDVKNGNSDVEEKDVEDDGWMDILGSGHLKKRIIVAGEPDSRPQKSDVLVLKFEGRLESADGPVVESVDDAEVNLGDNEVVQGLDFALALMDKGEEAEILVKSRFAFGDIGRNPDVPPGATLLYKVHLKDVRPEPAVSSLPYDQRLAVGLRKKGRGNWWYTRDEYTLAITCYRRALEYFDDTEFPDPKPSEDEVRNLLDERLKTYNNLGAAQIKINGFDAALISFGHVLAAQPQNVKALYRKSSILKAKGELAEAIAVVQQGLAIEPDNRCLQSELQTLLAAQRRDNTKQRNLYKKMLGTGGDVGSAGSSENKRPKPESSKSNVKWMALATAVTVAIASAFILKYTRI